MKKIIEKIRNGDHLTNIELALAIAHYDILTMTLQPHGEAYHLVYVDTLNILRRLRDAERSRAILN